MSPPPRCLVTPISMAGWDEWADTQDRRLLLATFELPGKLKGPRSAVRRAVRLRERLRRAPWLAAAVWSIVTLAVVTLACTLGSGFPGFFVGPAAPVAGPELSFGIPARSATVIELGATQTTAAAAAASGPAQRVCLITPDIAGPNLNGGIGTAFSALAVSLAAAGHNVTLASSIGPWVHPASSIKTWRGWQRHFGAQDVALVSTGVQQPRYRYNAGENVHRSYEAYLWLQDRDGACDTVHFPEWGGAGYFTALAKRQGLAFARTRVVIQTHSPTSWATFGNEAWPGGERFIETDFMERESIRLADILVTPSRYMVHWMAESGWRVPTQVHFLRNVNGGAPARSPSPAGPASAVPGSKAEMHEIVFFGRLERRKGVFLFLDVAMELVRQASTSTQAMALPNGLPRVTLIGKEVADQIGLVRERVAQIEQASKGQLEITLITTFGTEQAQIYLAEVGSKRVAIIPSLMENVPLVVSESMAAGVALLATNVGGIPELLDPQVVDEVTFPPQAKALLGKILDGLQHGVTYARPRPLALAPGKAWDTWHRQLPAVSTVATAPPLLSVRGRSALPMVSVVVTTHNGHIGFLTDAVNSLAAQAYPADRFEVILVDDGSTDPDALAEIASLEPLFGRRGWRQLHTANGYLGAARNAGAAVAKGVFLMFMDDDNLAKPAELATFVTAHTSGERKDALVCLIDDFSGARPPTRPDGGYRWLPMANKAGAFLYNSMGDANMMFRTDAFRRIGGFTTDRLMYEDWEILTKAAMRGLVVQTVPDALFWKRNVEGSMSDNAGDSFASTFRAFRPVIETLGWDVAVGLMMAKHTEPASCVVSATNDFRTMQGFKGLSYEYRTVPATGSQANAGRRTASGTVEPGLWTPFTHVVMVEDGDGNNLDDFRHHAYELPVVARDTVHPAVRHGTAYIVSKKWTSFTAGTASISWDVVMGNADKKGDGVVLTIETGGAGPGLPTTRRYPLGVNHTNERGQFSLEVGVGTTLRFAVDPGATMDYDLVWLSFEVDMKEASPQAVRAGLIDANSPSTVARARGRSAAVPHRPTIGGASQDEVS